MKRIHLIRQSTHELLQEISDSLTVDILEMCTRSLMRPVSKRKRSVLRLVSIEEDSDPIEDDELLLTTQWFGRKGTQ